MGFFYTLVKRQLSVFHSPFAEILECRKVADCRLILPGQDHDIRWSGAVKLGGQQDGDFAYTKIASKAERMWKKVHRTDLVTWQGYMARLHVKVKAALDEFIDYISFNDYGYLALHNQRRA